MDFNWFQLHPTPQNAMKGVYNYSLVTLSYIVAVLASYVALDITGILRNQPLGKQTYLWIFVSALCMGGGIWSMHFIGMLAFQMQMPMQYELSWTLLSILVAILAALLAIFLLKDKDLTRLQLGLGGLFLGIAIVSMHYLGMTAMTSTVEIRYIPSLFVLSILIAIAASEVALWLSIQTNKNKLKHPFLAKILSAMIMGIAIAGMHYTGMAAAVFTPKAHPHYTNEISASNLGLYIGIITITIIGFALVASTYRQLLMTKLYLSNRKLFATRNKLNQFNKELENRIHERTYDLETSLSLLKASLDATADGFMIIDQKQKVIKYNSRFLDIWEIPENVIKENDNAKVLADYSKKLLVEPDNFISLVGTILSTPDMEYYHEWKFKDRRIIAFYTLPYKVDNSIAGRVISFRDVTSQKRLQERLEFQYEIISLISQLNPFENTITTLLEKACQTFDWQYGNYWQFSQKENFLELKHAWFNGKDKNFKAFEIYNQSRKFHPGEGFLGKVCTQAKADWISDLKEHPEFTRKSAAEKSGLTSVFAFPILLDMKIYGVLEFFSKEYYPQDQALLNLFENLSRQVEIYLKRIKDQEELRLLTRSVEATQEGILIVDMMDPIEPIIYVNPAFTRITGYTKEESLGKNCRFLQRDDRDQPELKHINLAQAQHIEGSAVLRNYKKDGTLFWNELHIAPIFNANKALTHYTGTISDVTNRKKINDQLVYQATHDELTKLPNRVVLFDRIKQAIAYARRDNSSFSLLYIDIDKFKFINDSMGHRSGDALLSQVANRLQSCITDTDTVARLGGDEFAVIVAQENSDNTLQKIVAAFNKPFDIEPRSVKLSVSIGISTYPKNGATVETLIQNADLAMYQAKASGRNTVKKYSHSFRHKLSQLHSIEHQLRFALEKEEFSLHYQPILDLFNGKIASVEALLRWNNTELGKVNPLDFIPIAEQIGLIIPIGYWAIQEACRQNKIWQKAGLQNIKITVNVSMTQFKELSFVERVQSILKELDFNPCLLELELTESIIMENAKIIIEKLNFFREMGTSISIDDFGTGYSSLSYLKQLPIEKIKIDKSFIQGIPDNINDMSITRAIIAMAESLSLKIVAEGVETENQFHFLKEHDCQYIQGYHLSKPLSAQECFAFIKHNFQPK